MKRITFISTGNSSGGAERIAYNICKEFHKRGFDSKMLARRIEYDADPLARELVFPVPGKEFGYSLGNYLDDKFSTNYLFYPGTWKIPFLERIKSADVVHLHNIHGHFFNILALPSLMRRKPLVWSLHDMWALTGKCTWSFDCTRYTESCGQCPHLASYPVLKRDTTSFHLKLKRLLYGKQKFMIITPSRWIQAHVEKSFLKNIPTVVIPSPYDSAKFYPEPKEVVRERLGIPKDKKVILFVASWINTIPHKGIDTFKVLLSELNRRHDDLYTVIVGHLEGRSVLDGQYPGKETGWVSDPDMLRSCFAAADLYISPTLADNSPCVVLEAMACGTVPIAYSVGGIPEQILDGKTGFIVPPGDKQALIEVVDSMLVNPDRRVPMEREAAERSKRFFSIEYIADLHMPVYRDAMKQKGLEGVF